MSEKKNKERVDFLLGQLVLCEDELDLIKKALVDKDQEVLDGIVKGLSYELPAEEINPRMEKLREWMEKTINE